MNELHAPMTISTRWRMRDNVIGVTLACMWAAFVIGILRGQRLPEWNVESIGSYLLFIAVLSAPIWILLGCSAFWARHVFDARGVRSYWFLCGFPFPVRRIFKNRVRAIGLEATPPSGKTRQRFCYLIVVDDRSRNRRLFTGGSPERAVAYRHAAARLLGVRELIPDDEILLYGRSEQTLQSTSQLNGGAEALQAGYPATPIRVTPQAGDLGVAFRLIFYLLCTGACGSCVLGLLFGAMRSVSIGATAICVTACALPIVALFAGVTRHEHFIDTAGVLSRRRIWEIPAGSRRVGRARIQSVGVDVDPPYGNARYRRCYLVIWMEGGRTECFRTGHDVPAALKLRNVAARIWRVGTRDPLPAATWPLKGISE